MKYTSKVAAILAAQHQAIREHTRFYVWYQKALGAYTLHTSRPNDSRYQVVYLANAF